MSNTISPQATVARPPITQPIKELTPAQKKLVDGFADGHHLSASAKSRMETDLAKLHQSIANDHGKNPSGATFAALTTFLRDLRSALGSPHSATRHGPVVPVSHSTPPSGAGATGGHVSHASTMAQDVDRLLQGLGLWNPAFAKDVLSVFPGQGAQPAGGSTPAASTPVPAVRAS